MVRSRGYTMILLSAFLALMGCMAWADGIAPTASNAAQTSVQVTTKSTDAVDLTVTPVHPERIAPQAEVDLGGYPQEILKALPRFGAALFAADAAVKPEPEEGKESSGAPVASAPVPASYIVGPGDELTLRVWAKGWEQLNETLTVSPEGQIFPPQLGQMMAAGQTLNALEQRLRQGYGDLFANPTVTLVVSAQRVVEVYVTGDAAKPGKYALRGAATIFTALYAAGGPSEIGSFRRITLSRAGQQPVAIDLYDYLLTGRRDNDVLLQPGDTVFIPPMVGEIGLAGEVRRPGRYELTGEATVADAIGMAGGLTSAAYGPGVQLWYAEGRSEWMLQNVDASAADGADLAKPVHDGNLIVVNPMLPKGENLVRVFGAVKREGYYPAGVNATVGSILRMAQGMTGDAHMGKGLLTRLDEKRHVEVVSFDVREQYYGGPEEQIAVRAKDWIRIFYQNEAEPALEVDVRGAVVRPTTYQWMEQMRISDLLLQAGGVLPEAYMQRADLLRLTDEQTYEVIPVDLLAALSHNTEADLILQRGDILTVLKQSEAKPASLAHISGFVAQEGEYPRRQGMRVSDLIFAGGGLLPGAGPEIEYTKGRFEGEPVTMRLQLSGGPEGYKIEPDMLLSDDDTVCVLGRGDFVAHAEIVYVKGRVEKPGAYAVKGYPGRDSYTVYDVLNETGGLLADANPNGIVVYRKRSTQAGPSQTDDLRRLLKSVNQETLQPALQLDEDAQATAMNAQVQRSLGSVLSSADGVSIVLPPREIREDDWVAAIPVDGAAILASDGRTGNMELEPGDTVVVPPRVNTVTVLGAVPRSGAVAYVDGQSCKDYIISSGGYREDAAQDRMVVVHANGSAAPVKDSANIQAGDVIVVPTKHIVRTVRTESTWSQWFKGIVSLATAALVF